MEKNKKYKDKMLEKRNKELLEYLEYFISKKENTKFILSIYGTALSLTDIFSV